MSIRLARFRRLYIILGTLAGIFILVNYVLLPVYVRHGSTLTVPNVIGLTHQEADSTLRAQDFQPVESDNRADPKIPMGSVVSQNPLPGAVVKEGRHVYLTISGGEAQVFVPQLGGRSPRDAKFALERYGLRLGAINYASSDLYPQNTIMNQSAAPGKELAKGSAVDIVVSKGRAVDQTTVPDLIGRSVSEAERMLSDVGLKRGNITYQASTNLLPNTVVDQFPRAGDSLVRGAGVDLFVVREASSKEEQRGAERLE